jgi:hypothetical protein
MTTPDIRFQDPDDPADDNAPSPKAMIAMSETTRARFVKWVSDQFHWMKMAHDEKESQWAAEEEAYRALPEPPKEQPYVGACNQVLPVIAMGVDPVYARLTAAVFKNSEKIMRVRTLNPRLDKAVQAFEEFLQYYLEHYINFRREAQPRILEFVKHGPMVFKVFYEDDTQKIKTYEIERNTGMYKEVQRELTRCKGPKIVGVPIQNFVYPPGTQHIQQCPIVFERVWMTEDELRAEELRERIVRPKDLAASLKTPSELDSAREDSARHHQIIRDGSWYECWKFNCRFDIDDNGFQESLIGIWHDDSQQLLQLQYNWYFHQRFQYVLIPYTVANDSLGGVGLCEMLKPFQESLTDWHQAVYDNAYLANCRVIVRKREGVETDDPIQWYAGKEYRADDPDKDVRVLQMNDVYPSAIEMPKILMGYSEKRTGISDYLTGRESPIVGSRATATSTMALIQEGKGRMEDPLENIRQGFAELVEMMIYIWIQYGTYGLEKRVFSEDVSEGVITFFDNIRELDIGSTLAVDLSATDSTNNKAVQQQMQLALIQTFMQFYQELIKGGQLASMAAQSGQPALAELVGQAMESARNMYRDFATKYEVPNPEEYLPELETFLQSLARGNPAPQPPVAPGGAGGPPTIPGMAGSAGGNGQVAAAGAAPRGGGY